MNESLQTTQTNDPPTPQVPPEVQGKPLMTGVSGASVSATERDDARSRRASEERKPATETFGSFAGDVHEYIREYIQLADQKAAFLFAVVTAMLAYLHSNAITKLWLEDPSQWGVSHALACVAVVSLVLAAAAAVFVVLPRLRGASKGIVFWKSVVLFQSGKEYAEHVLSLEPGELTTAKLEHCYELATVCTKKYRVVNFALWCGAIGLLASVLKLAFF